MTSSRPAYLAIGGSDGMCNDHVMCMCVYACTCITIYCTGLTANAADPEFDYWPWFCCCRCDHRPTEIDRCSMLLLMQVGAKLEPSWGKMEPSWAKLGQVGPSWDKLGQVGPSWGQVGPSWVQVRAKLGPSWTQVGSSWAKLGPVGPSLAQAGARLGPSRAKLG